MNNHAIWMLVSGLTGFSCFVVIHFTKLLKNQVYAATLQLCANSFVFVSWGAAFLDMHGLAKAFALCGTIVPVIMATLTIRRVFWRKRQPGGAD